MNKLDLFYWYANCEVYHGGTSVSYTNGGIPGATRIPSREELKKYFKAGGASDYDPKQHWCGIFQVYLLQKANVACHWERQILNDAGKKELEIVSGDAAKKDLQKGDILRVKHNQHHIMVIEPATRGAIKCIEGNAGSTKNPLLAANWAQNSWYNLVEEIQFRYRILC